MLADYRYGVLWVSTRTCMLCERCPSAQQSRCATLLATTDSGVERRRMWLIIFRLVLAELRGKSADADLHAFDDELHLRR